MWAVYEINLTQSCKDNLQHFLLGALKLRFYSINFFSINQVNVGLCLDSVMFQ